MNEERTGKCLEKWNISVVISDRYFIMVNQVFGGDRKTFEAMTYNITKRNPWFSSFLVSINPLSRKS